MRVLARVCIVLIALAVLSGPALYLGRDTLGPLAVSWLARVGLGLGDLGGLGFRIAGIDSNTVTLEEISLGDGRITAGALGARFDLSELLSGHLKSLTFSGLTIRTTYRDGRLDLGPFEPLLASRPDGETEAGVPRLPIERLILKDARLLISSPWGELELSGDIEAEQAPGGPLSWAGDLHAGLISRTVAGGGSGTLDAGIDGRIDTGGDLSARLSLKNAETRFKDVRMASANGGATVHRPVGARPMIRAVLGLAGLRVRGTEIPTVSLDAYMRDDTGSFTAVVGGAATSGKALSLAADLARGDGERVKVSGSAQGAVEIVHAVFGAALGSPLQDASGTFELRGELALPGPLAQILSAPAPAFKQAVGTGGAALSLSSVTIGEKPRDLDVQLDLTAIAAPGVLEVRAEETSHVQVPAALARSFSHLVPPAIRPWFRDGAAVELGKKGSPVTLIAALGGDDPGARLSGSVSAVLGKAGRIGLEGAATLRMPAISRAGGLAVAVERLMLTAGGLEIDASRLDEAKATFSGGVGAEGVNGDFTLEGAAGIKAAGTSGDAKVSMAGHVGRAGSDTRISLSEFKITAATLRHEPSGAALTEPLTVVQAPQTMAELSLSHAGGGVSARSVRAAIDISPLSLKLSDASDSKPLRIVPGRLDGEFAEAGTDAPGRARLTLESIRLENGDFPIGVSGLSAGAAFDAGRGGRILKSFDITLAEIADRRRKPWLAPVKLQISGEPGGEAETLVFKGALAGVSAPLAIPFKGGVRTSGDGSGWLDVAKTVVDLGGEPSILAAMSPALAEQLTASKGRISFSGRAVWREPGPAEAPGLTLDIEDVSVTAGSIAVENAVGGITLTELVPPRSNGRGSLTMDLLGVGVPIQRPHVEFSIDGPDRIRLHDVAGGFAGGRISASDVIVSPGGPLRMTLRAEGVNAAALSDLVKVRGLAAEGRLSGTLPVAWVPGLGLTVHDARLSADGPGTVRYKAGERDQALRQSGKQVGLMLDALSDFRFKTLDMRLNGAPGAGYRIGLALEGSNPDLYDGYPVRFNLDLSGQLDDIIKTGYRTYTLPDRVWDAVLRGEAND